MTYLENRTGNAVDFSGEEFIKHSQGKCISLDSLEVSRWVLPLVGISSQMPLVEIKYV